MKKKYFNHSKVVYGARKKRNELQKDDLRKSNSIQSNGKNTRHSLGVGSMEKRETSIILELWIEYIKELKSRNVRISTLEKYYSNMDLIYENMNQRIKALEEMISHKEKEAK
ncbi:uncharacterized protein LOC133188986 [Saccostrea echinata]|uniref:uncharacterized protein LOC133188986 n=1 Tax=Saccostrea echinata TaxID=191078 RepID=UPI002A802C5A|nr:uncharacterized protein LOC133188986 [Saccostrea echinata]